MRTVTTPIVSVPSPSAWTSQASNRGWPSRISWRAWSTARYRASIAPLPSADARQWWSPASRMTAPREREFEPDVTVQRARRTGSVDGSGVGRIRHPVYLRVAAGSPVAAASTGEMALVATPQLGAGLPDRVLERVGEGRCGRRDDVRVGAHRRPRPGAVLRVDDDPGARGGRRIAIEDAHLVVDEVDVVDGRVERPQRLAQRGVEGVDRAVAVGGRVQRLAVDGDLDRGLGQQLAAVALLHETGVVDDPERRGVVGGVARMSSSNDASAPSNARPSASSCLMSCDSSRASTTPSSSCPSWRARIDVLARPPSSLTTSRPAFPTGPGSTCWYDRSTLATAAPWTPPLWAKADRPTYGW